ncbi:MAG: hypothetical protein ABI318_00010 [Chthoniobacteraceae bacterium]
MGVLKPFVRTTVPIEAGRMPSGCFAVHREGGIICSTLPQWFPARSAEEIGHAVINAFRIATETNVTLNELSIRYSGLTILARDLRGGALIFLVPNEAHFARKKPPTHMNYKNLEDFILHLETHIECWKQFNTYVTLARDKKFTAEDDAQFLDLKSLLTQGTEIIHASDVKGGLRKEDVLSLFASAPSLRYLAEMSDSIPAVEGQWHRIYLHLQSLLGQLKVQQNKQAEKVTSGWSLFGKK